MLLWLFFIWIVTLLIIAIAAQGALAMSIFVWVLWFIVVFLFNALFGEEANILLRTLKASGALSLLTMMCAGVSILLAESSD